VRIVPLLAALLLAASPAAAWDYQGHMLTGMLAHDRLAAIDPEAIAAIERLMAAHPDRARFDRALAGTTGPERTRRMFAWMARWPDDARKTPEDRPEWHYAVKVVHGWTFLGWYTAGEAFEAYADNLKLARDRTAPAAARAVALCWVFHILGDMHQPLHRGHRMDFGWLKTDRAATVAYVRRVPGGPVMDLHESWDSAASVAGPDPDGADRLLPRLSGIMAALPQDRAPRTLDAWAAESEALARDVAYRGSALAATPDKPAAPVLDGAYQARARVIAEQRIATAGDRLGRTMEGLRP
jgi:hypothetical protein